MGLGWDWNGMEWDGMGWDGIGIGFHISTFNEIGLGFKIM
jgi:hypothetical protein